MLRYLVEVLPVMICPRWVHNRCQPIAIGDVLFFLVAVLGRRAHRRGGSSKSAGPTFVTYRDMMLDLRRGRRAPPAADPARAGLVTEPVVALGGPRDPAAHRPGPAAGGEPDQRGRGRGPAHHRGRSTTSRCRSARRSSAALARVADLQVTTSWSDATLPGRSPADPMPTDPDWAGGSLLRDQQECHQQRVDQRPVPHRRGHRRRRGWYVTPILWSVRGFADKLIGGVGMRRGRRNPDMMWVGDAVDFWRVEAVEPDSLIRLRAEMKLPGEAWIEWRIEPEGPAADLDQRAIFYPRGLLGRAVLVHAHPVPRVDLQADVQPHRPSAAERPDAYGAWRSTTCVSARWRLTAEITARSEAMRIDSSTPTPHLIVPSGRCVST